MQRHSTRLYYFAVRHLADRDEGYDVVQETFVSVWESLRRYDPTRPFDVWLRRIALNKCRDRARKSWVRRFMVRFGDTSARMADDVADHALTGEMLLSHADAQQRFEAALASLPQQLREPLILTLWEGLSNKDAAEILDTNVKAIENRIYRAKKQLATLLQLPDVEALLTSSRE